MNEWIPFTLFSGAGEHPVSFWSYSVSTDSLRAGELRSSLWITSMKTISEAFSFLQKYCMLEIVEWMVGITVYCYYRQLRKEWWWAAFSNWFTCFHSVSTCFPSIQSLDGSFASIYPSSHQFQGRALFYASFFAFSSCFFFKRSS